MKNIKNLIKKIKPIYYIVTGLVVSALAIGIIGFNFINSPKDNVENTAIISLSRSAFESTLEKDASAYVIMGESQNDATKMLLDDMAKYKKEHKAEVYYFDTSFYTQQINNAEEKDLASNIKEYQDFMDANKIRTLPCVVLFEKGKAIESSGQYLKKEYHNEKDSEKKKELAKEATANLNKWLKKTK